MNILMMTNSYAPTVGGLERSVEQFAAHYRKRGHRTVIVAPAAPGYRKKDRGVVRVPSLARKHRSNFSIQVPVPGVLTAALSGFKPDIVHSHHPFMLGSTALRVAYAQDVPLVFTHHTLFEHYTHWLPMDSPGVKRFVVRLAVGYANLCDMVFAPSRSVKELLLQRGVHTPVMVVPTGLRLEQFRKGHGAALRQSLGIPKTAFLAGHVGRLGPEKNLSFLARCAALFLHRSPASHFLLAGNGPSLDEFRKVLHRWGVGDRLHCPGTLHGQALVDAYHAIDLFAFSSKSETQGLVLLEAMASGAPVAALKAPGVVDLVRDGVNGFLQERENVEEFAGMLARFSRLPPERRQRMRREAERTASGFSMETCGDRALEAYRQAWDQRRIRRPLTASGWARAIRWIRAQWRLVRNYSAAGAAWVAKDVRSA